MELNNLKMTETLTKFDIISAIRKKLNYSKLKSIDILENFLEIFKEAIENEEDIVIVGFGKFCVKNKNARKGRNPATGEKMKISRRKVVSFKCSSILRNKINKN